jgi:hypothetical protein
VTPISIARLDGVFSASAGADGVDMDAPLLFPSPPPLPKGLAASLSRRESLASSVSSLSEDDQDAAVWIALPQTPEEEEPPAEDVSEDEQDAAVWIALPQTPEEEDPPVEDVSEDEQDAAVWIPLPGTPEEEEPPAEDEETLHSLYAVYAPGTSVDTEDVPDASGEDSADLTFNSASLVSASSPPPASFSRSPTITPSFKEATQPRSSEATVSPVSRAASPLSSTRSSASGPFGRRVFSPPLAAGPRAAISPPSSTSSNHEAALQGVFVPQPLGPPFMMVGCSRALRGAYR